LHNAIYGCSRLIIAAGIVIGGSIWRAPRAFAADYLLAYEGFAAPDGALHQSNSGSGWAAGWTVQNNSVAIPGYNIASLNPLTYAGLPRAGGYAIGGASYQGSGRKLDVSSTGPFAQFLANGLIGKAGQTLYFGSLARKDADTNDELSITLHPGNVAWWVQTAAISVGYFGQASNVSGIRYWSLKVNGTVYPSSKTVVARETAFLAVRIDFGAVSTVSLYLNPPTTGDFPDPADVQVTTSQPVAFQSLAYYGGSNANLSSIDEIRFAANSGVLMSGTVPPPRPPVGISAAPGNAQITLAWSAVSDATSYEIWRAQPGSPELIATTASTTYTAVGLVNRTAYTFYLVSVGAGGEGPASAQVTAVPRGLPPPARASLGTNLSAVVDYSREWPFVDAFKMARPWISQKTGMPWGQGGPLQTDESGWVTSLAPGQYAETIIFDNALDDQVSYPTGDYTLLYDGEGTIAFEHASAAIIDQTPGRMVVRVPGGQDGIFLMITQINSSNPIRNIRFIMPGFESTYQTQPFHPLFLARLQIYKVLRFMEWMRTNGSPVQQWSDRPRTTDYTYAWRGVPLEVMIQLANTTGLPAWLNIPHQATDDFVYQFAALVNQQLNRALKVYIEYSNETWNQTFSQSRYVQTEGVRLGFSSDSYLAGAYYTAFRSTQIFNTFQTVFGGTDRLARIISSQAANSWLSDQMLGFQNAFSRADALAIAPYFSCSDANIGGWGFLGDPSTADQVSQMTVDQVLDIELSHIRNCSLKQMQDNAAVAGKYGLSLIAYEGGQSLVGVAGAENNSALTALFKAANRHPRMRMLYSEYLQNWKSAGGDLFLHYSDVCAYTKYGNWGATETQDQDPATAPKYQALSDFAVQNP